MTVFSTSLVSANRKNNLGLALSGHYPLLGECSVFKYIYTIRSHLVIIVPMTSFTPKSTSKLRSALHIRYSIVIPRFISRANTAQT